MKRVPFYYFGLAIVFTLFAMSALADFAPVYTGPPSDMNSQRQLLGGVPYVCGSGMLIKLQATYPGRDYSCHHENKAKPGDGSLHIKTVDGVRNGTEGYMRGADYDKFEAQRAAMFKKLPTHPVVDPPPINAPTTDPDQPTSTGSRPYQATAQVDAAVPLEPCPTCGIGVVPPANKLPTAAAPIAAQASEANMVSCYDSFCGPRVLKNTDVPITEFTPFVETKNSKKKSKLPESPKPVVVVNEFNFHEGPLPSGCSFYNIGTGSQEAKLGSPRKSQVSCQVTLDDCNLDNPDLVAGKYSPQLRIAETFEYKTEVCQAALDQFYRSCDHPKKSQVDRQKDILDKINDDVDSFLKTHPDSKVNAKELSCLVAKEDASFQPFRLTNSVCMDLESKNQSHAVGLFQMEPQLVQKMLELGYCGELKKIDKNANCDGDGDGLYNQISTNEDLQIAVGIRAFDFYLTLNPPPKGVKNPDDIQFSNTLKSWLKGPGKLKELKGKQAADDLSKVDEKAIEQMHVYDCQIRSCYTCMKNGGSNGECFAKANSPCGSRRTKK